MVRAATFAQIGGFDQQYVTASDSDWLFRAKDANIPYAVLPEAFVRWRIHQRNQSWAIATIQKELLSTVRHSIVRQRQQRADGNGKEG
jgi:hypothetical protein